MVGSKRRAVILSLIESMRDKGGWCGETHIQKGTYFLQELMKVPTEFDFILYKHGPFSFELRDELSNMRADMILEIQGHFPLGPSHIPGKGADSLKQYYPKTIRKYKEKVEFISEKLSGFGVAQLERVATSLYVTLNEKEGQSLTKRAEKIVALKPHIKIDQAIEATETIDTLIKEVEQTFS
ncbi:MAG: hypothetical protein ABSA82_02840 [Thermacetogeniaceae bacterium]